MRLFTGIELPQDLADGLERLAARLRPAARLRWTPAANLHITTRFIGEWPEQRLDALRTALAALPPFPPFEVRVRGLGFRPNRRAPRLLWCGIESGGLAPLARATDQALLSLGLEPEGRAYSPHLTLARIPDRADLTRLDAALSSLPGDDFGAFSARSFFLYSSRLGPGGSVYTKLAEFPFPS